MRDFNRSKFVLSLLVLVLIIAAALIPLSGTGLRSHAMNLASGPEPKWALPFPPGTSVNIGPLGLHDHNFRSMVDDRTGTVFTFKNQLDPDSLDIVLQPPATGTSTIPATSLANGTVLAVWAACQLVLIDHGNGWWAIYLHLANIQVTSGNTVTAGSILGYPTTNLPTLAACGNVESTAEHVHFAFLKGSGTTGHYVPMLGKLLDGHAVVELNNDPTDIILQGLTTTKDQVFTVPACGVNKGTGKAVFVESGNFYALNASDGSLRWCYPVGGEASPAVANGVVYFGSDAVYALNTSDGSLLWRYPTGASGTVFDSSPAVVNGVVYIGSFDNSVYALNAQNGSLLWRYHTGSQIASSPAVVNGVLYIGSGDAYVYALNASNGSLLWRYQTGGIVNSSPAVADGKVVISSLDGYLYALQAANGSLLWRSQTGGGSDLSPALVGGVVYTNPGFGSIYALRARDGSLLWSSPAPGSGTLFIGLAPRVVGGVVYASGVYAFNASNGSQLWYNQVTYSGGATSEPNVNAGMVYVGSSDGNTYALNTSNGSILWKYPTGSVNGTPAVS